MFSKKLISWYLKNDRDLPWRKSNNPYFVWLSEIMLQQTKVSQGLPYFLKFTEEYPTVFDLANAEQQEVLKLWQGLGYYSRARNLHFTAKYIANELNGKFPDNYKELLKLKGVGDYTASAIASICFDKPNAVVDGNVYRVLSRVYGIETAINSSEGIKEFKQLAQALLDTKQPGIYNQAIMDFGALHCKPKNPLCVECFFQETCVAFSQNKIQELPFKEKKIKVKKRYFNYLFVNLNNKFTVINQRTKKGIWQDLFELPLIETSRSIDGTEIVLLDEFQELFAEQTTIFLFNPKEIVHKLSHQHLITKFWIVKTTNIKAGFKLVDFEDLNDFPVPVLIDNFFKSYFN